MSFCSIPLVTYEFQDWKGAYAAFRQNLMMSVLYLWMFFSRDDLRGQTVYRSLPSHPRKKNMLRVPKYQTRLVQKTTIQTEVQKALDQKARFQIAKIHVSVFC